MLKSKEFFGSGVFAVPMGVESVKVFAVGGGGAADVSYVNATASHGQGGGGGGAGGVVQATIDLTQFGNAFTGDLNTGRSAFVLVELNDGKILAIGGEASGGAIATCELYDPTTGVWTSTGSMSIDRSGHSAVLLNDGTVLVAGGWSDSLGETLTTSEIYDPGTGVWTVTTNPMNYDRAIFNLILLQDGTVLAAGGFTSNTYEGQDTSEIYDPTLQTWTQVGNMVYAVGGETSNPVNTCPGVLLPAGTVAIFGGDPGTGLTSSAIQIYDPVAQTWSYTSDMVASRAAHSAILLSNGLVLIAGGTTQTLTEALVGLQSAELYDPTTNVSTETTGFPYGSQNQTIVTLADGHSVALIGGLDSNSNYLGRIQVFDPTDNSWTVNGSLLVARYLNGSILLNTDLVLIAGGASSLSPYGETSSELYGGTITSVAVVIGAGGAGSDSGGSPGSPTSFGGYVVANGGGAGGTPTTPQGSGGGATGTISSSFSGAISGGGGGGAGSPGENGFSYPPESAATLETSTRGTSELFQGNVGGAGILKSSSPTSGETWAGGDGGAPIMVPDAVSIPWAAAGGGGASAEKASGITIAEGLSALAAPTGKDGAFATGSGGSAVGATNPGSGTNTQAGGSGGSGYILVTWEA